ncbi:MAG: hypothetical protein AAB738_03975 [Patescibacteria group bacterium]
MSNNFSFFKKLLVLLRAQTVVGGLEISDSAVRFARFSGREWQMVSLRVPPGVIQAGKILNLPELTATLSKLKSQIPGGKGRQKISVAVCLSSLNIYTQVVNLPTLDEGKLDEAVRLNTQMVSSLNPDEIYSGWQAVGENESEKKLDILSAFINQATAEGFVKALRGAGFLPVTLESRAMALSRLARERGVEIDKTRSYVVLVLDNEILDFLAIRHGQLYFEYPSYWRDLKGEGKLISLLEFRAVITGNLKRVLNFYSQHWSDQPEAIIVIASGLNDEIKKILKAESSLPIKNLELRLEKPVEAEWFGVLGSGLRGIMKRKEDLDISLLGTTARDEFRQEQIMSFMRFWRVMVPVAMGLLIVFFVASFFILSEKSRSLKQQTPTTDAEKMGAVAKLQEEASVFNRAVDLVGSIRSPGKQKILVLDKIVKLLADHEITLMSFGFSAFDSPLTLYGTAKSQSQVLNFIKSLGLDTQIKEPKYSLTDIKPIPQGFSFSVSFIITSPKTE